MELSLREGLEAVEEGLLMLGVEIDELLKKQEHLLERKQVLQAQLDSIVRDAAETSCKHLTEAVDWENGTFQWSTKLCSLLTSHFKLDSFRPLQKSAINATLSGKDVILIMPTGGGKSLCYQLPCLIESGVSLVISPLVSLMEDQSMAVERLGIRAAMLSAHCSREHVNRIHVAMTTKGGDTDLKILYVTPEKLSKSKRFMSKLEKMYELGRLSRIVIDEIHCASQWGHDFRPDYKILGILKRQFPDSPILGLTATATAKVLVDCQKILSLKSCLTFRASYNRANLFYEVRPKLPSQKAQIEDIAELIRTKFQKQSGIVYCLSRNNADEVCRELCLVGISAGCYHAYCLPGDRTRVHTQWLNNTLQVIVATIAFGMGIDKSDVRFVMHHSLSKSMENYYQESGRAGRDGNRASCILFYRAADVFRLSSMVFTEHTGLDNLHTMTRYCINGVKCRRALIADSFGERWTPDDCSVACDVCAKLQNGRGSFSSSNTASLATVTKYEQQMTDISRYAGDLVQIIAHNHARDQRLTAAKLVEVWRGNKQSGSARPAGVSATKMAIELCDRIVVTAVLEGVLCEEFHYTAYTTICYMGLGRKAELAKKGLLHLELSSLVKGEERGQCTSKSLTKRQEATPTLGNTVGMASKAKTLAKLRPKDAQECERESECVEVSPAEVSTTSCHGNLLPSMILTAETSDLLAPRPLRQTSGANPLRKRRRARQPSDSSSPRECGSEAVRSGVRQGKGKRRKCSAVESSDTPSSSKYKRLHHDDVIEIDDDSD